jgi:shikimate kinase
MLLPRAGPTPLVADLLWLLVTPAMNIFLIGYRGCGKTTVARLVADELGWPWVDADDLVESRAGKSIKQIFAESGERAFRDLETAVITELAPRDQHVVALGGGAILREKNREALLAAKGLIVWLQASAETLYARIVADPTTIDRRPNLTAQGGVAEIRKLLAERTPLYRLCAGLTVDADRNSPAEIARQIVASLPQKTSA